MELSTSDPIPCDSQTHPCTNISSDNLGSTSESYEQTQHDNNSSIYISNYNNNSICDTIGTHSDDTTSASSKNSSTYISHHNQDTPSDTLYMTPREKSDKPFSTRITRNPPSLSKEAWADIDTEFMHINQELWDRYRTKTEEPEQFIADLNLNLAEFLKSKSEFQHDVKEFYKHSKPGNDDLEEIKKKKNMLNKKARQKDASEDDKLAACEINRMYNYLLKLQKEKDKSKLTISQEKAYRKDFWKTAKDITNDTFGDPSPGPTFTKDTANSHYKNKYEKEVPINFDDLSWFPKVEAPKVNYNMSPYTPKDVRLALYKKCSSSAPGEDEIVYAYLKKMPFLHKVLATAFTGIWDKGVAPESWARSKVILIKKDKNGPDDDPANFRMISLTLNIGKLYHTLEAQRMINFMVANGYLDPVAQKAYIEGINGCVEHVCVVQEIMQHARLNHKTVNITWFDLADAFGSINHLLIPFVMKHYNIPTEVTNYIINLYSKLKGKVVCQDWESDMFKFLKGAFQGDPLSGVIFLIVFNPILEYKKKLMKRNKDISFQQKQLSKMSLQLHLRMTLMLYQETPNTTKSLSQM